MMIMLTKFHCILSRSAVSLLHKIYGNGHPKQPQPSNSHGDLCTPRFKFLFAHALKSLILKLHTPVDMRGTHAPDKNKIAHLPSFPVLLPSGKTGSQGN